MEIEILDLKKPDGIKKPRVRSAVQYPFDKMEVGKSFAVPIGDRKDKSAISAMHSKIRKFKDTHPLWNFSVHQISHNGVPCVGVWRDENSAQKPLTSNKKQPAPLELNDAA